MKPCEKIVITVPCNYRISKIYCKKLIVIGKILILKRSKLWALTKLFAVYCLPLNLFSYVVAIQCLLLFMTNTSELEMIRLAIVAMRKKLMISKAGFHFPVN